MRRFQLLTAALLLTSLCSGCSTTKKEPLSVMRTEEMLGTFISITAYGEKEATLSEAVDAAFERAGELEQILSPTIAHSELNAVNAAAYEQDVLVSDPLWHVLTQAQYYSALSDGALDCTIGDLIDLWGIGTDQARLPSPDEIQGILRKDSYTLLTTDTATRTVRFQEEGLTLQFGAVAKGYIADEMKAVLQEYGVESGLLVLGGNIMTIGDKPSGEPWKIAITDPFTMNQIAANLTVTDQSVVTSGNYERYFEENDVRYHHILDPETGYPSDSGLVSATIIADSSLTCDALSTAAFVLGAEEGMALIESLEDTECIFITESGEFLTSSGIGQYHFTKVGP